jgi:hypothetical protein
MQITGRDIHEAYCVTKPEEQRKPWEDIDEHDQALYNAVAFYLSERVAAQRRPLQGSTLSILQLKIALEGAIEVVNDLQAHLNVSANDSQSQKEDSERR